MDNYLIITGASRGIGKSVAEYFLQNSWKIINLSRTPCDIPHVINIKTDLGLKNWPEQFSEEIKGQIKSPERICLVHNAAFSYHDTIQSIDLDYFQQALQTNLFAPLILNKFFLPLMGENSSIIYMGSMLSEEATPGSASYIMIKHAIAGAMKATCQDLLDNPNIHTCCICPGATDTEMLRAIFTTEQLKKLAGNVSKKRLIQPNEIAALIYFCAQNPIVNGSLIHANLGPIQQSK